MRLIAFRSRLMNSAAILLGAVVLAGTASVREAQARTYTASDQTSLNQAITDANGDGDPTSTITLTGDIALPNGATFIAATKPITLDTNGHTISGWDGPPGSNQAGGTIGFSNNFKIINSGALNGGDGDVINARNPGTGLVLSGAATSLTNTGTITGGAAGLNAGGGNGAQLVGGSYVNSGTIRGGTGGSVAVGGTGVSLSNGSLTNEGLIEGGAGNNAAGGHGMSLGSGTAFVTNNGTIRGAVPQSHRPGMVTTPYSRFREPIKSSITARLKAVRAGPPYMGGLSSAA